MPNSYLRTNRKGTHAADVDRCRLDPANTTKAPGSHAAVKGGCKCDPVMNRHGLGCRNDAAGTPIYSVDFRCAMHGGEG